MYTNPNNTSTNGHAFAHSIPGIISKFIGNRSKPNAISRYPGRFAFFSRQFPPQTSQYSAFTDSAVFADFLAAFLLTIISPLSNREKYFLSVSVC